MRYAAHHLQHFKILADELHFGRAARLLNIAQPALSRSIKHLEGQIGVLLFKRNNRVVELTSAGEVFLKGCRQILESMETTIIRTQKASQGEAGNLMIGYTDFAISGSLPEILRDFTREYPDISVEPVHGFTGSQLESLQSGKLDVAFITGPFDAIEYESVVVQQDLFVAVFYENHPLAKQASVSLSDLANDAFILGSPVEWAHYHDHLFKLFRQAGFKPRIVQHAFNTEGIFGLVACEMGITIQLECVYNYLRKGLIVRPIHDVEASVPTMAVWKKSDTLSPQQVFGEFLKTRYKQPQG